MRTITIEKSYNYFGDTVISFEGRDYNVFQHNCSNAKELLKKLEDNKDQQVFLSDTAEFINETKVIIQSAITYLKDCIALNDEVEPVHNLSAGAEIFSNYGY